MPDREKVIRAVETCFDSWIDKHRDMGLDLHEVERMKRDALELLKEQEPVRCKDCKIRGNINLCPLMYIEKAEQFTALCIDEWFCGNGKRR